MFTYLSPLSPLTLFSGRNSCRGISACEDLGFEGKSFVGDDSCRGPYSCHNLHEVTIGNESCNCEYCCACLPTGSIVPDGSCNDIAQNRTQIDFVDGVGGERCCQMPLDQK